MYRALARHVLFRQDAEAAHRFVIERLARWRVGGRLVERLLRVDDPRLAVRAFGIDFAGPLGLAAGLDKHAEALAAWPRLGFDAVEVGTVTPRPQPGNPRPRLFRLVEAEAIINRLGFNSVGAAAVGERLPAARLPVGVNVGRNRDTANERAVDDYCAVVAALAEHADWLTLNLSSPNTPGLRELQAPRATHDLVAAAVAVARTADGRARPVLVKLAPDFSGDDLERTAEAALDGGAAGLIATNTTLGREGVADHPLAGEAGGLSGPPLRARATAAVRRLYRAFGKRAPIVGVGGIDDPESAYEKIRAGATLLQLYTGLIYRGPGLPRRIHRGLLELLARDGFATLAEAVGVDAV